MLIPLCGPLPKAAVSTLLGSSLYVKFLRFSGLPSSISLVRSKFWKLKTCVYPMPVPTGVLSLDVVPARASGQPCRVEKVAERSVLTWAKRKDSAQSIRRFTRRIRDYAYPVTGSSGTVALAEDCAQAVVDAARTRS